MAGLVNDDVMQTLSATYGVPLLQVRRREGDRQFTLEQYVLPTSARLRRRGMVFSIATSDLYPLPSMGLANRHRRVRAV